MLSEVSRKSDEIKARKLFEATMTGDADLLTEMINIRIGGKSQSELPDTIAGANGEEICEKFQEVYSTLYNCAGTKDSMEELKEKIASLICCEDLEEVDKMTGSVVKEAVTKMKPRKGDVSEGFTSDCLLNGPDTLFEQLSAVFRSWLVHGKVTSTVLSCAFLPLLKSPLKDGTDTAKYRAIAGSSQILMLFESCILLLWGGHLSSNSLQFGYKKESSTTQAIWLVQEVVGHYLSNGSNPIVGVLDCSRAFDLTKWDVLFSRVLERGVPPIVVRAVMWMYEHQSTWVRWGDSRSNIFSIMNGTRQGSRASPALWSVYCV